MKGRLIFFALTMIFFANISQAQVNIIPLPNHVKVKAGKFIFGKCTKLQYNKADVSLQIALAPLVEKLHHTSSIDLSAVKKCTASSVVVISLDKTITADEGYALLISSRKISLKAKTPVGIFYGVQSILQLLP